ncbi:serine/threonine-protein kinase [Streptomyces triculaminicus]|uniref:serine/threonine-protein kinase n=1 Tax=Streptomyces triculaminicus TaxID=2816232 RepID=UPI0033C6B634
MGPISGNYGGALRPLTATDPREIAGYRLLARIGEGGMGSVYLSHTRGNQPVALKMIRREYAGDGEFRRRFQHEVRAAQQVRGYHLVPVVDHDSDGEQPWLATAYVPGLPLDEALRTYGPLPLPAALQLVGCVARALESVHAAGVIHRDLKPGNILLAADGPWVIDFGIARAAEATQLTRSGGFIGTPQFMSPEHGTGADLTPAADLFSLGLIAAVTATGNHPYGSGSALTVATQIANTAQRPPDLSGYPDDLRPLLESTLAADPAARPTPRELADLCERASCRPPRAFDGWLPAPLAAAVGERERRMRLLLAGEGEQPPPGPDQEGPRRTATYVPTQVPGHGQGAPSGDAAVHAAPTQAASAAPATPPPPAYTPPAHTPPAPATTPTPPSRGRRTPLAIGLVVALAVVAGTAWAMSGDDEKSDAHTDAKPSASAPAAAEPSKKAKEEAKQEAKPAKRDYETVFADRPLTIGPPANGLETVDFDAPRVSPQDDIPGHDTELSYMAQWMNFKKATAKSKGTTPQECRQAVDTAPLPAELTRADLMDKNILQKDDVLCTVTSKGNLAMLKITEVSPTGKPFDPPGYSGLLTLWKQPS